MPSNNHAAIINRIKNHVMDQFNDQVAQKELREMKPSGIDWNARTKTTIETLLPRLPSLAILIQETVPLKLNSPSVLMGNIIAGEKFIRSMKDNHEEASTWHEQIKILAATAKELIGNLESQQISAEIQRTIISGEGIGDLVTNNGKSIYPDTFLRNYNYDDLPKQRRKNPIDGPCLKGQRPSNVPDGCEIKTNRGNRIHVDAHGAHPGLHLGVTWDLIDGRVDINGVWVAYIRIADHRESVRNVKITTVKYSFGHDRFISLL